MFLDPKKLFSDRESVFVSILIQTYQFSLVSRLEVAIFTNLDEKSLFSSVFVVFFTVSFL